MTDTSPIEARTPPTRSADRLRQAAVATAAVFFLSGAVIGTWVSRLPAVRDRLDASTAELGLALLMPGVGSLLSMPLMGRACTRWGSSRVVLVFALLGISSLPWLARVGSIPALGATLLFFGLAYGAWDVAMNVHGAAVEQEAGRAWMPRYHACWSVGGITGSGLGALAARAGVGAGVHFGVAAVVAVAILLASLHFFVDHRAADRASSEALARAEGNGARRTPGRARLLTRRLVAIGVVTAGATCIEGAAADWLALFLRDVRSVPDAGAAAGYTAFAIAMATGRFAGTPIIERLGRARAVRIAGCLTGLGVVVTVGLPWVGATYAGALLWGLGVALVFPAAMSAGGEVSGRAADGIAAVSTIGYAGFLIGPPMVGFLAHAVGLGRALLALLLLAATIVALAPALRPVSAAEQSDATEAADATEPAAATEAADATEPAAATEAADATGAA